MAELTKQALKVANNTEFPNNNNGAITPSNLRGFNLDMIDSTVNQAQYTTDSGSWNQQIDALEQFTASASGLSTGSLLITASAASNVITFTKGNGSTFNVTVADTTNLTPLNTFTASAEISITNLNASSASQQVSINALNTNSASVNTSITNLNVSSASQQVSIDSLNSKTGSYATTGSNIFVGANTFTSISASSFVSASEFIGNGTKITGITASISMPILDEGIPQGNAVSLNFTGSAISAIVVGGTAVVSVNVPDTGSFNSLTASFNSYTASTNADLNAIHQATASLQTNSASVNTSISALNTFTASQSTASLVTSINNLNTFSASALVSISNINSTTASLNTSVTNLNASSASQQISIDALNTNSASVNTSITNLNSATQSLFTSASLGLTTASFSAGTLTFTKGNGTTFGVVIPDVSGSDVPTGTVSGSAQITALGFVSSSVTASSIITASVNNDDITFTKGDGSQFTIQVATGSFAVSASYAETASLAINAKDIVVNVKNTTGVQINKGTVVRIIGATGDNPLIGTASWENDSVSANTLGFVVTDIANDAFGRVMTQGTLLSVNTDPALGYTAGQLIYLSSSGQYTNVPPPAPFHEVRLGQVLRAQQNNGSIYVLVQNGYELSELHDVNINTGSLANNNLLAYNSSSQQWENKTLTEVGATTTSSFNAYTSSTNSRLTNIESTTASLNTSVTNLNSATASLFTSASLGLTTASFSGNTLTFTKGDSSTFGVVIPDVSGSTINTGSFATTGSNSFVGNQTITGSVIISSSAAVDLTVVGTMQVSGSATGAGTTISSTALNFVLPNRTFSTAIQEGLVNINSATTSELIIGVFDEPNFVNDVELNIRVTSGSGIEFKDWDNGDFGYETFMSIAPNVSSNPDVVFKRSVDITGSLDISGNITASLQSGHVLVGNAAGRTTTVATSSFGGGASFPYSGSVEITGSVKVKPFSLSVASSTASIDMNESNYFILNLPTSSTTHIAFTNINPGETINLLVSQSATAATGSITFAPNILFPNGNDYQPTATGSAADIVSFISFTTAQVFASQVKNLY